MRSEALAAMWARLRQVEETRDLSSVLQVEAVRQARELADLLPAQEDLEIRLVLGWFHWYRSRALPASEQDLQSAVQAFTPCFVAGLDGLPKPLLPHLAEAAAWHAHQMLEQAQLSPEPEPDLLSATVDLWRRILLATPAGHPGRVGYQSNLGSALRMRFDRGEADADLETAIDCFRLAMKATPLGHADRAGLLTNLGIALMRRFEHRGGMHDLDAAVTRLQEGVEASPLDDPDRAMYLSNLGAALRARFERTGVAADLEAAVGRLQEAVDTPAGHPDRAVALYSLGLALQRRAEENAATADLDAAIDCFTEAVEATAPAHPERAARLSSLGIALQARFARSAEETDSDTSIDCFEKAVRSAPADDPGRAASLSNLGTALQGRFSRRGEEADLKTSVDCFRKAVNSTPANHPSRAGYLSHLGAALEILYERTGAREDLQAAIQHHHEAVATTPTDHPDRGARLTNLGTALQTRFEWNGEVADLDSAVDRHRDAVQTTPVDHPDRAAMLSNLGIALQARFEWTGAVADLENAVHWHQQAVDTTSTDHPSHARYLSNLADARRIRYERTGEEADLQTAVQLQQQAVDTTPVGHPERAPRLSNLGISLQARFERLGALTDLQRAVDHLREAVDTTPGDHPSRAMYLSNLGTALQARYERTSAAQDLDMAIDRFHEAVDATPADHPDLAPRQSNLASSLQARYERSCTAQDLTAAVNAWLKALDAASAAPSIRIHAGISAAGLLTRSGDAQRAADVTEAAVRLLPQVVPRRLERGDQQHAIGSFAGLAGAAAARALAAPGGSASERAERALGLLEAGRAVLLGQALDTRSDLTDLSEHHPELARRFAEQRKQLDQPANAPVSTGPSDAGDSLKLRQERTARDRHRLAEEFSDTLAEIHRLGRFASFGLPPAIDELITEASHGPVVVFNVHTDRSDALLLTTHGITSLALTDLVPRTVVDTVNTFRHALHLARSGADLAEREQAQKTLLAVLRWLWDAAMGPVLEALEHDRQPAAAASGRQEEPLPRVWWAPGGLLGLLPLHAAGHHSDPADDPHRRTVMDRVVSSYTPTVRALRYARERASRRAAGTTAAGALIVAMPTTPQVPGRLHFVDAEAAMLQARLPDSVLLREPDPTDAPADPTPSTPTKANVLAHLPHCAIAHFACHGASHPTDPSKSLLLLHDHDSDPLTVQSLAPVALDQAKLAYLSACRTAAIDTTSLLDEAIHLASAFQLAGFPHVIGTLWGIDDRIAVRIAEAFYEGLKSDSTALDPDRSARALHEAVRRVRDGHDLPPGYDRRQAPSVWAAHLHAGA
ncbi:CHAT domain-containing protein [Streptomyces sp. NPDC096205]|uniref:CHAT domain-containing tetratricopeptide repeat protein n=1 Tax=Streptomyces sp. NPDC096205 TaxID=3366081 RepID=UPI003819F819